MSTFDAKVEVVTDFLRNRASLRRLTDYQEVSRVAGELLYRRAQRRHGGPVDREKIADVLQVIDNNSLEDKGILLSALVVHFWDNDPGHRFFEQAVERGLLEDETDDVERLAFHAEQLEKVFAAYPEIIAVNLDEVIVPDDPSSLEDEDDYEESEF